MLKGQAKGPQTPEEFERLVSPHVASFDYFIGEGMETAVRLLEPLEVRLTHLHQHGSSGSSSNRGGSSSSSQAAAAANHMHCVVSWRLK